MNIYRACDIHSLLSDNPYVGRGIMVGKSRDGCSAVTAYFIEGRSANSRNRIFTWKDGALFTEPFDPSRVEDPSLIIYAAMRRRENRLILTNGDQTDTVYRGLAEGKSFAESLATRCFEPDAPNFTPRISAMLTFANRDFTYEMSILKSIDEKGSACARYHYAYPSVDGLGHFLHTYMCDGDPCPTFTGEPERIAVGSDIDEFTREVWDALDPDNRISLFTTFTDLATGVCTTRLINKNK